MNLYLSSKFGQNLLSEKKTKMEQEILEFAFLCDNLNNNFFVVVVYFLLIILEKKRKLKN